MDCYVDDPEYYMEEVQNKMILGWYISNKEMLINNETLLLQDAFKTAGKKIPEPWKMDWLLLLIPSILLKLMTGKILRTFWQQIHLS